MPRTVVVTSFRPALRSTDAVFKCIWGCDVNDILLSNRCTVGRSSDCNIVMPKQFQFISGKHLELSVDSDSRWFVTDRSSNWTALGDRGGNARVITKNEAVQFCPSTQIIYLPNRWQVVFTKNSSTTWLAQIEPAEHEIDLKSVLAAQAQPIQIDVVILREPPLEG